MKIRMVEAGGKEIKVPEIEKEVADFCAEPGASYSERYRKAKQLTIKAEEVLGLKRKEIGFSLPPVMKWGIDKPFDENNDADVTLYFTPEAMEKIRRGRERRLKEEEAEEE